MPGLNIVYDQTGESSKQKLKSLNEAMNAEIMHFDWYKKENVSYEKVAFSRVSLGLLNSEPQPVNNKDGSLLAMLYGELYDTEKIRRELVRLGHEFRTDCDAELALHLYEEKGEDFVFGFNGSFIILIYDKNKHKLLIFNDRYGTRPLYWTKNHGYLLIASEIKALLADKSLERKINFAGLVDQVIVGYLLHNKTMFEGIEILPAATIMIAEGEEFHTRRYWSWYDIPKHSLSYNDAIDGMGHLWMQAIDRYSRGPFRLGVTLSGGLDSRAVLSAVVESDYPVSAWTFGSPNCLDIQIARQVCEVLGVEHQVWLTSASSWREGLENIAWMSDGLLNILHAHAPGWLASIREHIDVRLNGFLGDVIAGDSYMLNHDVRFSNNDQYSGFLIEKYSQVSPTRGESLAQLFTGSFSQSAIRTFRENVSESVNDFVDDPNAIDFYFINNRGRRFINIGSTLTMMEMVDRKPFLDNDFVEFIYSLPSTWKVNSHLYSDMLLRSFPTTFSSIPWQKTGMPIGLPRGKQKLYSLISSGKRISNAVSRRTLMPFLFPRIRYVDYANWMRTDPALQKYIVDLLLSDRTLERGFFERSYVSEIVDSHLHSRGNHSGLIGVLLTFEIFCRQFIDEHN